MGNTDKRVPYVKNAQREKEEIGNSVLSYKSRKKWKIGLQKEKCFGKIAKSSNDIKQQKKQQKATDRSKTQGSHGGRKKFQKNKKRCWQ